MMSRTDDFFDFQGASPLKQFSSLDGSYLNDKYAVDRFSDDEDGAESDVDLDQTWENSLSNNNHSQMNHDNNYQTIVRIAPKRVRRNPTGGKWTIEEDEKLKEIVTKMNGKNWKKIASLLGKTRSDVQCLHRWNKVLKPGLHKGAWSKDEDDVVRNMVLTHGVGKVKWSEIASQLPGRIGKQCRERWFNHLDPTISKLDWTEAEDRMLFIAQKEHGNRWHDIAKMLPGRTENAVKNRWNSSAMKKWLQENAHTQQSESNKPKPTVTNQIQASTCQSISQPIPSSEYIENENILDTFMDSGPCAKRPRLDSIAPTPDIVTVPDYLRPPRIVTQIPSQRTYAASRNEEMISISHALSALTGMKSSPIHQITSNTVSKTHTDNDNQLSSTYGYIAQPLSTIESNIFNPSLSLMRPDDDQKKSTVTFDDMEAIVGDISRDDDDSLGDTDGSLRSQSPTSEVLFRVHKELDKVLGRSNQKQPYATRQTSSRMKASSPLKDSDLIALLPHFKYLSDETQRRIIKQLLSKFNSTSFTPRNYCLIGTPRHAVGHGVDLSIGGSGVDELVALGSPNKILDSIDPNCFDMDDIDENNKKGSSDHENIGIDLNGKTLKDRHRSVSSDELTYSAVVSVAVQIATGKLSNELMKILNESYSKSQNT